MIGCGGQIGVPAAVFDDPNYPDAPAGLERDALDETVKVFPGFGVAADQHWRLALQTADAVVYVTQVSSGWISASVRLKDGKWIPAGMGGCQLMAALSDGLGAASWALDPGFAAPKANATEMHILVWEFACSGGSPATGRMSDPIVTYSANSLIMTVGVTRVGGPATCPGPPGTPALVVLPQPIGDRTLLDGIYHPAQPPKPL